MYTSAFRRLANVTQVVSADEVHVFHNRLTHSLQVAQVARRLAEVLFTKTDLPLALDADVCEAAALAHDLGHPPFGHLAEQFLNKAALKHGFSDGFEGNAQSFRIVTKLSAHDVSCEGLDLTRATLDAILKYPWRKGRNRALESKWGAYDSEDEDLAWARLTYLSGDLEQSLEAAIMDWSDDVTYSVHDVEDFYRAGIIPLETLGSSKAARESFYQEVFSRMRGKLPAGATESQLIKVFEGIAGGWQSLVKYSGSYLQRRTLKSMSSSLIGGYVTDVTMRIQDSTKRKILDIPKWKKLEVFMLKQLTWHYVILNPALASQQHGQEKVIEGLVDTYRDIAWDRSDRLLRLFPYMYREKLLEQREDGQSDQLLLRTVLDFISGMTERQAIDMHHRLNGVALGSALSHALR